MQFLTVFVVLLSVAFGAPVASQWSLAELSDALQNPATDPAIMPYLEDALNQLMSSLVSGVQQDTIMVSIPVEVTPIGSVWSLAELSDALQNPATDPAILPYLEAALNELMSALVSGVQQDSIVVSLPLEVAQEAFPAAAVTTPAAAVATPVEAASAPLVQIIVNINGKEGQQVVDVGAAASPAIPEAVSVVEQASEAPISIVDVMPVVGGQAPIQIVDVMPVVGGQAPVQIVDVMPVVEGQAPVQIVDVMPVVEGQAPVQIVDVMPVVGGQVPVQVVDIMPVVAPSPANPIDVIAVAAPEINPIDILAPIAVAPGSAVQVVGPIV